MSRNRNGVISRLVVAVLIALVQGCGSSGNTDAWLVDEEFSSRLMRPTLVNGEMLESSAHFTVDSIQVYKIEGSMRHLDSVAQVRRHRWIWESSNPTEVATFFAAALDEVAPPEDCVVTQADEKYVILAYDRDLMRVGLISYFACPSGEGALDPYGSPGVTFSSALAPLVQRDKYWPQ